MKIFHSARIQQEIVLKKKKKKNEPWKTQNMSRSDQGWIGLNPTIIPVLPDDINSQRSDWGGIVNEDLWRGLYESHTKKGGGFRKKVGSYYGADEAFALLKSCISAIGIKNGSGPHSPSGKPEDSLWGTSLDTRCAFDSAAGSFCPKAGSCNLAKSPLWPDELKEEYSPGKSFGSCLLPLVLKPFVLSESDQEVLDKIFINYIDTGVVTEWQENMGLPTVVVPANVVWQMSEGAPKPRATIDLRYSNGCVPCDSVELPTVIEFAKKIRRGDLVSKQDLKAGYHQFKMKDSDRHLAAIIWRGKLYCFTCMTFGWRDAPFEFQKRTSYVARKIKDVLNVNASEVYVDDFFQSNERVMDEPIRSLIAKFGLIMSKSKCKVAAQVQEILGIMIDAGGRRIFIDDGKIERITKRLEDLLNCEKTDTLTLSGVLGFLASIEPAVPLLLLLVRPLYADLKDALVAKHQFEDDEGIPMLRRENDKSLYQWSVEELNLSDETKEAIRWLAENLTVINGQGFDQLKANLLVRSDASEKGVGGTVRVIAQDGAYGDLVDITSGEIVEYSGSLPEELLESASIAREAEGTLQTCRAIPTKYLKGATLALIVDNQGLACRYWKGTRNAAANRCLIELAKMLFYHNARIALFMWVPREKIDREDQLSRQILPISEVVRISRDWFDSFIRNLPDNEVPNVDAFADKENALFSDFASLDGEGSRFDGCSCRWNATDVPWCFPPLGIINVAIRHWAKSDSKLSYWCVPEIREATWWKTLAKYKASKIIGGREVPTVPRNEKRTFSIYCIRK